MSTTRHFLEKNPVLDIRVTYATKDRDRELIACTTIIAKPPETCSMSSKNYEEGSSLVQIWQILGRHEEDTRI